MNNLTSKDIVILGTMIALEIHENNPIEKVINIKRLLGQILTTLSALC